MAAFWSGTRARREQSGAGLLLRARGGDASSQASTYVSFVEAAGGGPISDAPRGELTLSSVPGVDMRRGRGAERAGDVPLSSAADAEGGVLRGDLRE